MAKTWLSFLLLIFLAMTWGSSFILMKKAMFTASGAPIFSAYQVAILRLLFASVVFIPIQLRQWRILKNRKNILPLLAVGVVGTGIPAFMFTIAEQTINSALAGMLNAAVPIMSIFVGLLIFKAEISARQWIGTFIGLIAVVGLSYGSFRRSNELIPIVLILTATLCYALSLNSIKYKLSHLKSLHITAMAFVFLIPIAVGGLFYFDVFHVLQTHEQALSGLFYVFLLGFLGTAVAVALYAYLVSISGPVFASTVTYLIPVVATLWGIADGEIISLLEISMMFLIIVSVLVINRRIKI